MPSPGTWSRAVHSYSSSHRPRNYPGSLTMNRQLAARDWIRSRCFRTQHPRVRRAGISASCNWEAPCAVRSNWHNLRPRNYFGSLWATTGAARASKRYVTSYNFTPAWKFRCYGHSRDSGEEISPLRFVLLLYRSAHSVLHMYINIIWRSSCWTFNLIEWENECGNNKISSHLFMYTLLRFWWILLFELHTFSCR